MIFTHLVEDVQLRLCAEVIRNYSCSAQLGMIFEMLIGIKYQEIQFFQAQTCIERYFSYLSMLKCQQ